MINFMTYNRLFIVMTLCASMILVACNFDSQDATPTAEGIIEQPVNPLPDQPEASATSSLTPSPSPSPETQEEVRIQIATQAPTIPANPTDAPTPTETLGPWEHTVQSGDTLTSILANRPYFYDPFSSNIVDLVVSLNSLSGPASIFEGQTLLIPRPTQVPISEGLSMTETAIAFSGSGSSIINGVVVAVPTNTVFDCHEVQEGETIIGIIEQYGGANLELLCSVNGENFSCAGCNFNALGGGEGCNIPISIGQCVNVPLPTATPTLSPTPSGNETATPTPTNRAPSPVSPPDGGTVSGGIITLNWVSVGVLEPDEAYLVQVIDIEADTINNFVTRTTSLRLPSSLIPTDGETHTITWQVQVGTSIGTDDNGDQVYAPNGAGGIVRTYYWQSR